MSMTPTQAAPLTSQPLVRPMPEDAGHEGRLAQAVIVLAKAARALQGLKLAELGFQNGQDELLLSLDHAGKTVSEVAVELDIRPSTVSKMVDRLQERKLVERSGDPMDARRTVLRITEEGLRMSDLLTHERDAFGCEVAVALPGGISIDALEELSGGLVKRLRRLR